MSNFHDFKLNKLGGGEIKLSDFQGKVLLVVNVASKCGLTPQYKKLEALYLEYKDQGFEILGIPCNQFMGQEPGTDAEIQNFCSTKYDVTFPLSGKIDVNGDKRDPLYTFLAGSGATFASDIQWNFEKFLIGRNGNVIKRFPPKVEPDATELVSCLKDALHQIK
jgi:glutathione peroxidase